MSKAIGAAQLLGARDLGIDRVPVPEWTEAGQEEPDYIWLRQLPASDLVDFQATMARPEFKSKGIYLILVWCACDEQRSPLFPLPIKGDDGRDAKIQEYVALLEGKNFNVLDRLQRVALRVNSMLPENREALKKD